jgi:hypothetical protein
VSEGEVVGLTQDEWLKPVADGDELLGVLRARVSLLDLAVQRQGQVESGRTVLRRDL